MIINMFIRLATDLWREKTHFDISTNEIIGSMGIIFIFDDVYLRTGTASKGKKWTR